jgi:hypothetical protein
VDKGKKRNLLYDTKRQKSRAARRHWSFGHRQRLWRDEPARQAEDGKGAFLRNEPKHKNFYRISQHCDFDMSRLYGNVPF